MSDDLPPKKPSGIPPLAPPVARSFPPVPRPSGTPPSPAPAAEPPAPVVVAPAAEAPEPVIVASAAEPSESVVVAPAAEPSGPIIVVPAAEAPKSVVVAITDVTGAVADEEGDDVEPPSLEALGAVRPTHISEPEPPSLEALVAIRPTQLSEPLALEALGSAAHLIQGPDTTPRAAEAAAALPESDPEASSKVPEESLFEPPDDGAVPASIAPAPVPGSVPPPSATAAEAPESVAVTTRLIASLMIAASLVMVIWHMQLSSRENANTGSRYATIESLVDYGTYNIDASRYLFTPDKVKARGHYVSSKPPLLPTYGAGVYYLLKRVTGYNITDNESIVVWTVGVFTGWLGHLVFLIYFYRLSRLLLVRQLAILVTVAAACFAYLGAAYATAINNHSVGAAFAVAGFYHAFRARHDDDGRALHWMLAGLALGVLPAIDLSSLALTGLTAIYLATKSLRRTLLLFVPATFPGLASQLYLAHLATGTYLPAYADASMMTYKGSYFGGRRAGIDALFEPKSTYAFNVLLGHHGLFSMTPLFLFSLVEIARRLWKRDKFVAETLVFTVTVMVVTAFYIVRTHNYGGWCVGMRWLVPVMPWLVLLFGLWLDRATLGRVKWALVVAAFSISAFNVQDGLTSPFQFSVWHNWLEDAPNRNRIGTTWVLSRAGSTEHRRPPRPARPRPKPGSPP